MKGTETQSWIKNAGFEKAGTLLVLFRQAATDVMLTPIGLRRLICFISCCSMASVGGYLQVQAAPALPPSPLPLPAVIRPVIDNIIHT